MASDAQRYANFIGGQWLPPSNGEYEANSNPADASDVIGHWPKSGREDAKAAIDAAAKAFPAWSRTPSPARGRIVARAHQLLTAKKHELALALCREEGKTLTESLGEVQKGLNLLEFYGGEGLRMHGKTLPSEMPSTFMATIRQPVGVAALVTPWNFPFAIPVWKSAPALVAGCTIVMKPASLTPLCATMLAKAYEEAGLPPGVFNLVTGPGSTCGDELVANPLVRAISFTGSNGVGLRLYQQAAARGARVTLEMGGKNPVVVLDDADLDLAVEGIAQGAFGSTGQRCTATSRVVATPGVYGQLCERLAEKAKAIKVGNGQHAGVTMGPAVDAKQHKTDLDYIAIAKAEGARLVAGGENLRELGGFFVAPTVFADVSPSMRLFKEEVFGPVLSITKAADFNEAVEAANAVEFGLAASIYTQSATAAMRFIERSEVGMVHVNQPTVGGEAQLPFGGIKSTGVGEKEMGEEGLNFFTHLKTVFFDYTGSKRESNIY